MGKLLGVLAVSLCAVPSALAQTGQFRWLESCQASGTCVSNTLLPNSGWSPRTTLPADMDRDGDVDIVSVGSGLSYIRNEMVLGAAPAYGVFTSASGSIGLALADVADGALSDLDGDGDLDMAVVTNPIGGGAVWLLMNTTLPAGSPGPLLVDAASAGWSTPGTFGAFTAIAAGDFDGDGDNDLMLGSVGGLQLLSNVPGAGTTRSFVNLSATRVAAFTGFVDDIAAADFDADGDLDVAIAGGTLPAAPTRTVAVNPGAAGQFVAAPLPASVLSVPSTVEAADLDGNGTIDLSFGHQATGSITGVFTRGELVLFTNAGAGAFAVNQVIGGPLNVTDIVVGDIDEDGRVDIAASCTEAAAFTFRLPGRTLLFTRPAAGQPFANVTAARVDDDSFALGSGLPSDGESIALADLDLDLDLDFVVGHRFAGAPGVFTNLLWQQEAPRTVAFGTLASNPSDPTAIYYWDVPYDLYCEFGIPAAPGAALGVVAATLTPPVHVFPAGALGVLTTSPGYVSGPIVVTSSGQGNFTMRLGPFNSTNLAFFTGTQVYAQAGLLNLVTNVIRLTGVVQTTLQ